MVGKTIAHYQILEKLGEGGMGVVYKARDTHLDRFVAIKVLPPQKVADPERKRRFVQEAKAASALNHPNIVHIYDIDAADSVDYIAMEYVAGKTLDELIPRKGMRLNEALKHGVQISDALSRAHAAGIIHRDLKPGNIMVDEHGLVKVLDFGLAKLTEAAPAGEDEATRTMKPTTEEGKVVGTVSYMSPEQAEGRPVDARSDIFSFGSLLYEMVAGRRAFQASSKVATLAAIINREPEALPAELPHDLQKLINRCLRKDPERRFQHMKDLKVELAELKEESDSGTLTAAAQPSRQAFPWVRTAALAVVAVVLAAAGWLWFSRTRTGAPEVPLEAVPLTSFPGAEYDPSFSPDGNEVAFCWNGEKRDNFDIYVQLIGAGPPQRLTTDPARDFSPAWSPDGRQIAFLRNLGSNRLAVMSIPARGGPESNLAEVRGGVAALAGGSGEITLAWHPGGKHLAVIDGGALFLLSTDTREKRRLTTPSQGRAHRRPAFSPDGRSLVFQGAGWGDLQLLTLDEALAPQGQPAPFTTGMERAVFPAWTADGREIIFSAGAVGAPNLWRTAVSDPGKPRRLSSVGEGGTYPALSRDGRRLVYSRAIVDWNIWQIEVSGRQPATPLIASTRFDANAQFSPDGRKIAFESNRSGSREIWVCDSDGSNAVQVTNFGGPQTGTPRWSPDGQQIAFDAYPEGTADIFLVGASGGKPRRLTTNLAGNSVPTWSRDGRWIYFSSNRSGRAEVWKTPAGENAGSDEAVQVTRNGGYAPFESRDGKLVYYTRLGGVWQVPVEGGEETQAIEGIRHFFSFAVADEGIYFIPVDQEAVRFFDFGTKAIRTVATLDEARTAVHLAVSPDGRTLLYTDIASSGSDLMLVENFR